MASRRNFARRDSALESSSTRHSTTRLRAMYAPARPITTLSARLSSTSGQRIAPAKFHRGADGISGGQFVQAQRTERNPTEATRMPLTLSYPGVYIEEVPSEVRTITGVATSITAFVGRAVRGQVNTPTIVNSLADFNRAFGGLGGDFPMSYAVRDFFLNGGSQAVIVRLFHAPDTGDGMARFAIGGANGLRFRAWHAGSWGEGLRVQI